MTGTRDNVAPVFPPFPAWLLARCAHNQDFRIRDALISHEPPIAAYVPTRMSLRKHCFSRKSFAVKLPALRPYMFVHIDDPHIFHCAFHSFLRLHPVRGLGAVAPSAIERLKAMEASGAFDRLGKYQITFRACEAVVVERGAFQSKGIVLANSLPGQKVKVGFASGLHGAFKPENVTRVEDNGGVWRNGRNE
jgi:hypothetical protein